MGNIAYGQTTWIGGTSSDWNISSNWTNGIPGSNDDVTIGNPDVFDLEISGTEQCNTITFIQDGIINFATTGTSTTNKLEVSGNFINNSNSADVVGNANGTIVMKASTGNPVEFGGTTSIHLYNLKIEKFSSQDPVTISVPYPGYLGIKHRLQVERGELYMDNNLIMMADLTSGTTAYETPTVSGLGRIYGTGKIQQRVQNGTTNCYHYLASPVHEEDSTLFSTIGNQFTDDFSSMNVFNYTFSLTGSSLPNWFTYNETACANLSPTAIQNHFTNTYNVNITSAQANWVLTSFGWESNVDLLTEQIQLGRGFMSLGKFNVDENIVTWDGYFNNGDIAVNLSLTSCDTADGLNFLGNPYPSPIDWVEAYDTNASSVTPFAYIWTPDVNAENPVPNASFASGYLQY